MRITPRSFMLVCALGLSATLLLTVGAGLLAVEPDAAVESAPGAPTEPKQGKPGDFTEKETPSPFGEPVGAKRLSPDGEAWVDAKRKAVIVDGEICLREGQLEMFACPRGTKEHESVVSVKSKAFVVHAALLAVGAKAGNTVKFDPKYIPATGTEIDITVLWIDKDGKKQTARAQEWVRNAETKKAMAYPWVFAGSGFWSDGEGGQQHYLADAGDFICVSNFPSAMLDLPVESTQANQGLLFEAFTEQIPPRKTKVRLILRPKLKPEDDEKTEATP